MQNTIHDQKCFPDFFIFFSIQHLDDGSGVEYIVTGCSNFVNNSTEHAGDVPSSSSKFFWADYSGLGGFASFYVTQSVMDMTFVDSMGKALYSLKLTPRNANAQITA